MIQLHSHGKWHIEKVRLEVFWQTPECIQINGIGRARGQHFEGQKAGSTQQPDSECAAGCSKLEHDSIHFNTCPYTGKHPVS